MIQNLLRILIGLMGAALLVVGVLAWLDPGRVGNQFGLINDGPLGLGTIRGDFSGFFLLSGGFALYGALRKAPQFLLVPLILMASALFGRLGTALLSGADAISLRYMAVEGVNVALLLIGRAVFSRADRHGRKA